MQITDRHVEALRPLMQLIYQREASGDYNAVNRGSADDTKGWKSSNGRRLTQLRLREVQQLQNQGALFAVGGPQTIPDTLSMMVREMKLTGTELFDAALQDRITAQLLLGKKRPVLRDYLLGKTSGGLALAKAIDDLAYEWASIPNSQGVGWYDDDSAGNKAKGQVMEIEKVLLAARSNLAAVAMEQKAGSKPAAAAAPERPILYRMVATQDTWLKKTADQASELPTDQVVRVLKGKSYGVIEHREVARHGHAQVVLAGGAGTWFVFEAHWSRPSTTAPQPAAPARPAIVPAGQIDWTDFSFQVSPFITVGEILQWDHRRRPARDSANIARILVMVGHHFNMRLQVGYPIGITSFYRPEPINREVGGVPRSFHTLGMAMDIFPVGRPLEELYQDLMRRWTGGLGDGRHRGFIHVDSEGGGGYVPGGGVRPRRWWTY